MKIILGHDIVVQEMEGSYWKALKITISLQKQTSEMELRFIHYLFEVFLVFKCQSFWSPTIDSSSVDKTQD